MIVKGKIKRKKWQESLWKVCIELRIELLSVRLCDCSHVNSQTMIALGKEPTAYLPLFTNTLLHKLKVKLRIKISELNKP